MLLGSVYSGKFEGLPVAWRVLAGLISYGCANTAFAGLAIQLVLRRENGILKRLRSTPLPPATYVAALLTSTLVVFGLQTVALFLLGRSFYGTPFPPGRRLVRGHHRDRRGRLRRARHRDRLGDPLRRGRVRGRQLHPAADGVPQRRVRADARAIRPFLRAIGDVLPLTYLVKLVDAVYLHGQGVWTQPEALVVLLGWGLAGLVFTIFKFRWEPQARWSSAGR